MRISLKTRIHEWLADHFEFIQYPDIRPRHGYQPQPPGLIQRYRNMTRKQRSWVWFAVGWTIVIYLVLIGPVA
jgi:hypothetical protein